MSDRVQRTKTDDVIAPDRGVDVDRRDALASIAKFSAYTAPALLLTVSATKAIAASACPPGEERVGGICRSPS